MANTRTSITFDIAAAATDKLVGLVEALVLDSSVYVSNAVLTALAEHRAIIDKLFVAYNGGTVRSTLQMQGDGRTIEAKLARIDHALLILNRLYGPQTACSGEH